MKNSSILKRALALLFIPIILISTDRLSAADNDPEAFRRNINALNEDIRVNQNNEGNLTQVYRDDYLNSLEDMLNTIRDALAWAENRVERARFASERCTYIANRVISISGRDLPPAAGALARRGAHPHAHGAVRRGDRERIERFDDNVERIRQARDLSVNTRALLNHANGRLDNIQGLVEEAERVLNLYNRDFLTEHDPQTTAPERGSYGVNRILNSMRDMLRDANESAYDTSLDAEEAINNSNDMWDLYRDYYPNDWRQRR